MLICLHCRSENIKVSEKYRKFALIFNHTAKSQASSVTRFEFVGLMKLKQMKFFPGIDYFALTQMAHNRGAQIDESDDERTGVNEENKEEDDEFTTYFSENRVEIPEIDKVRWD